MEELKSASEVVDIFTERLIKRVRAAEKTANDRAIKEYIPILKEDVKTMYEGSVQEFYDSYHPDYYSSRTGDLKNLIELTISNDGMSMEYEFIPERLHYRNGESSSEDGLYDLVFRKGWHGGATHINSDKEERYGSHPNPGTPYYRTPYDIYSKWGRRAIQTESPLSIFNRKKQDLEKTASEDFFKLKCKYIQENLRYM